MVCSNTISTNILLSIVEELCVKHISLFHDNYCPEVF